MLPQPLIKEDSNLKFVKFRKNYIDNWPRQRTLIQIIQMEMKLCQNREPNYCTIIWTQANFLYLVKVVLLLLEDMKPLVFLHFYFAMVCVKNFECKKFQSFGKLIIKYCLDYFYILTPRNNSILKRILLSILLVMRIWSHRSLLILSVALLRLCSLLEGMILTFFRIIRVM